MRARKPVRRNLSFLVERPIAHRGLHEPFRCVIENTATAFEAAIRGGYAIECDLQISSDGEAMVFHDDTLARLVEGKGPLKRFTAKQLRSMTFKQCKDRMQTLGELLEQVAGRTPLVIELKTHWDGNFDLVQRAAAYVAEYKGPFGLMSFDPDMIAALREIAPRIVRGMTADKALDPYYAHLPLAQRMELRHFSHLPRTSPHFVSFNWHDLPVAHIVQIREAGYPVISWTIRSPADAVLALKHSDQITFEGFIP
jgi:glycerophosphoryl diester phosphodiesterase